MGASPFFIILCIFLGVISLMCIVACALHLHEFCTKVLDLNVQRENGDDDEDESISPVEEELKEKYVTSSNRLAYKIHMSGR